MGDCSRGCFALLQQASPRLTVASANRDLVEVMVQGPPGDSNGISYAMN